MTFRSSGWKLAKTAPPKSFTAKPSSSNQNHPAPNIKGSTATAGPSKHGNTATTKTINGDEQAEPFITGSTTTVPAPGSKPSK